MIRRTIYREENVSAKPAPPCEEAWVPGSYEHSSWPSRAQVSSCQGPRSSVSLIHRIRTRAEFERLGRSGKRVRNELLWCTHLHDPSICPPQVAFAIGRAHGPAVTRNRLRRRLRPILLDLALNGILPPGHLLMGINRSMTDQVFSTTPLELKAMVSELIGKLTPVTTT